jgi:lactate dehydrogenase-like 2-hydroxyacid dehydrogenase
MLILIPDAQFDDDARVEREVLGNGYEVTVHRERRAATIPDATWRQADAIICYHEVPHGLDVIDRLERCRIIVRAGVGYDQIDVAAAAARGIPVCNVPDYGTTEVADHAIALMLGLARGLVSYHLRLLADPHAGWHWSGAPLVRRLRGSRFGVVGLGRIGLATARRAAALDMQVAFYDPHIPDGAELAVGYERFADLHALLQGADVLSLHCPLTAETRHLIDATALQVMPPHALLINTARGALIDIDALDAALKAGQIAGAGLDVLPEEPPDPQAPLLQAFKRREPYVDGRLLLTPHAAWASEAGRHDLRTKSASTVKEFLERQTLRNCVNRL